MVSLLKHHHCPHERGGLKIFSQTNDSSQKNIYITSLAIMQTRQTASSNKEHSGCQLVLRTVAKELGALLNDTGMLRR